MMSSQSFLLGEEALMKHVITVTDLEDALISSDPGQQLSDRVMILGDRMMILGGQVMILGD